MWGIQHTCPCCAEALGLIKGASVNKVTTPISVSSGDSSMKTAKECGLERRSEGIPGVMNLELRAEEWAQFYLAEAGEGAEVKDGKPPPPPPGRWAGMCSADNGQVTAAAQTVRAAREPSGSQGTWSDWLRICWFPGRTAQRASKRARVKEAAAIVRGYCSHPGERRGDLGPPGGWGLT